MKKRNIVWVYLFALSLGTILSLYIPKNEATAKEAVVIPGQAIRLRILANSDLGSDQVLKRNVRDAVNAKISVWVKNLTSMKEARKVIQEKLPEIQATAEEVVKNQGSNQAVKVKFGKVSFPTKLYGEFLYPAGKYQAILITLGEGKGANWWCVLFPPLCFLDFSNGVAVSDGFEEGQHSANPDNQKTVASAEQLARVSAEKQGQDQTLDEGKTKAKASHLEDSGLEKKDGSSGDWELKQSQAADQEQNLKQSQAADQEQNLKQSQAADQEQNLKQSQAADQEQNLKQSQDADQEQDLKQAQTADQEQDLKQSQAANQNQEPQQKQTVQQESKTVQEYTNKDTVKTEKKQMQSPIYTAEDEQPIKVKFFVVELWNKLFK